MTRRLLRRCVRGSFGLVFAIATTAHADTLFVAGTVPVTSGDAAAISQLEQLGETVTIVEDSASTAASAAGMDLVVISDSVTPASVGNKFKLVAVPVLSFEPSLYDNLGMTGLELGVDFGRSGSQDRLRISGANALTAGLTGVVTVTTAPASFSWGKPTAAAMVGATHRTNTSRPMIFGYDRGDQLANGNSAPARRVGFFLNTGATDSWNANGRALFRAAARWALDDVAPPPGSTVRILPLGDSITRGRIGHWSYRRDLEALLIGSGCSFNFVGSESSPSSGPGEPLNDRDNEGHSSLRTDQIRARLHNWLPGNDHDWALIHAGTNDTLEGTSITAARTNLSQIIDQLRGVNPNVGILLAQIIPNFPENEFAVTQLNDEIADLAADKTLPGSPVIAVDMYSGYDASVHNYDGIHPNDAGESRLAQRWFNALHPRISNFCTQ